MPSPNRNYLETKKHLKITGSHKLELVEPHLLYLEKAQADAYIHGVMEDRNYIGNGFHGDLVELIKCYSKSILTRERPNPNRFELVDLGPGYPDKTLPLTQTVSEMGVREILYMPIDVSPKYLKLAADEIKKAVPQVILAPKRSKFEDLNATHFLAQGLLAPHIFLGLTYMNFFNEDINRMLERMSTRDSMVLVASELITPKNTVEVITSRYTDPEVRHFVFGPLANLGYNYSDFESDVRFNHELSRVEIAFTYKGSVVDVLGEGIIKPSDEVITFVSYRYPQEDLDSNLSKTFSRRTMHIAASGNTALVCCQL